MLIAVIFQLALAVSRHQVPRSICSLSPPSISVPPAPFCCPQLGTEYHKRFDPIYSDARSRISTFGAFNHFSSYMAQPKQQLDTFR